MIEVIEFKEDHLKTLLEEEHNESLRKILNPASCQAIEELGLAKTILCAETKKVLFCGGVMEYWKGRGECWAVFHHDVQKHFVQIHRAVIHFFKNCPVKRIEASVLIGFEPGHRWMKSLGFTLEAPLLRAYQPGGRDCALYALVKES